MQLAAFIQSARKRPFTNPHHRRSLCRSALGTSFSTFRFLLQKGKCRRNSCMHAKCKDPSFYFRFLLRKVQKGQLQSKIQDRRFKFLPREPGTEQLRHNDRRPTTQQRFYQRNTKGQYLQNHYCVFIKKASEGSFSRKQKVQQGQLQRPQRSKFLPRSMTRRTQATWRTTTQRF